jgi:hypothetical protein
MRLLRIPEPRASQGFELDRVHNLIQWPRSLHDAAGGI